MKRKQLVLSGALLIGVLLGVTLSSLLSTEDLTKDCGSDIVCFKESAAECSPAKITLKPSFEPVGSKAVYQISPNGEDCDFKSQIFLPEDYLENSLNELNENELMDEGQKEDFTKRIKEATEELQQEMVCTGSKEAIAELFKEAKIVDKGLIDFDASPETFLDLDCGPAK